MEETGSITDNGKNIRSFALITATALLLWGMLLLRKNNFIGYNFFSLAAVFVILGLAAPVTLRPVYKLWRAVSAVVGFLLTGAILTILFFAVVTSVALLAKIFGKKFMDIDFKNKKNSYWVDKEVIEPDRESCKRQF
jgi:NADH:ubiquinone oxidoreductase subunit 5 (subunit L)/multisubunit Na+/H+ antiporter MnhA subunit